MKSSRVSPFTKAPLLSVTATFNVTRFVSTRIGGSCATTAENENKTNRAEMNNDLAYIYKIL